MVDPITGFFLSGWQRRGNIIILITLIVVIALTVLGRILKNNPDTPPKRSKVLAVSALVLAAAFVVDLFQILRSNMFSHALEASGMLLGLYIAALVLTVLSAAFFVIYAICLFTGAKVYFLLPIMPILLGAARVLIDFTQNSGIANIEESIYGIFHLCMLLLFWLMHGRMISQADSPRATRWIYGVGISAALLSFMNTLSFYLLYLMGGGHRLHATPPGIVYLVIGAYIVVFLMVIIKEGSIEQIETQPRNRPDQEEKNLDEDEDMVHVDRVYDNVLRRQNNSE